MIKMFLLGLLLVNLSAFGDVGYIRIDNKAAFLIATNCWDGNYKNGSGWVRTAADGFCSCTGAYIRVDIKKRGGLIRVSLNIFGAIGIVDPMKNCI